jgi:hypothetical protein
MSVEVTETAIEGRVALIASAARVPLASDSGARIARAVTPTLLRFATAGVALTFEIEPSSLAVIARGEIRE